MGEGRGLGGGEEGGRRVFGDGMWGDGEMGWVEGWVAREGARGVS